MPVADSAGTSPVPVIGSRGGLPGEVGVDVRGGTPIGGPAAGELAFGALAVGEAPGDDVPDGDKDGDADGDEEADEDGDADGDEEADADGEEVGGLVAAAQNGVVMSLSSSVTAPLPARARPTRSAPVFMVIEVSAMMLPTRSLFEPSVAELATCQNTLHGEAPLRKTTVLFEAVINVEEIWKMNTAPVSFCELSVSSPVN